MHVQFGQNCHCTGIANMTVKKWEHLDNTYIMAKSELGSWGNSCLSCTNAQLMTSVDMETDVEARCKAWLSCLSKIKIQNHLFRRNETFCEVWGQRSLAPDFLNKLTSWEFHYKTKLRAENIIKILGILTRLAIKLWVLTVSCWNPSFTNLMRILLKTWQAKDFMLCFTRK